MGKFIWKAIKFLFKVVFWFVLLSVLTVAIYKFMNPPATPIMVIRSIDGLIDGKKVGIEKEYKRYDEISPNLYRAIIAAEDARFLDHDGIDWKAVEEAREYNRRHKGKKKRGASTISMQTAKNVFLWHGRNYVRKGLEAYFTTLIEAVWGKKRILEVYANVVEWGPGLYGAEAASQKYFNKPAINLTKRQAALMAATLPNPRYRSPAKPTPYLNKRAAWIQNRMSSIRLPE